MKFDKMIARTLSFEGAYLSPAEAKRQGDPGGETHWGISKRSYPNVNIKDLTREQAIGIYRRDFWDAVHGDELPTSIGYLALDACINSGPARTIMWLQTAAGVADDGRWGPVTRKAVVGAPEADMVLLFLSTRLDFMTRLANWPVNSRGWARRIAQLMRYAAEDNNDGAASVRS